MGWSSAIIKAQIKEAVQETMYAWVTPLEHTIDEMAAEFGGSCSRPLLFGSGVYNDFVGSNFVIIENDTPMQGTNYGVPEVIFVENGLANYHMPSARPFMEESGQKFAKGDGLDILQSKLDAIVVGG